jgi:hypothetical protein
MVQNSLWAHPYECRKEIVVIASAFEVRPYIHFFVAHDADKDRRLREKFVKTNRTALENPAHS